MSSTWGERIKLTIFGGSHTEAIGVNLDGLPAGEAVDLEQVLVQMARRAPGQDPTATRRKESDTPRVLCGLYNGVTTGAPPVSYTHLDVYKRQMDISRSTTSRESAPRSSASVVSAVMESSSTSNCSLRIALTFSNTIF